MAMLQCSCLHTMCATEYLPRDAIPLQKWQQLTGIFPCITVTVITKVDTQTSSRRDTVLVAGWMYLYVKCAWMYSCLESSTLPVITKSQVVGDDADHIPLIVVPRRKALSKDLEIGKK